jgi:hypothetical protein
MHGTNVKIVTFLKCMRHVTLWERMHDEMKVGEEYCWAKTQAAGHPE